MFCRNCGKELTGTPRTCPNCGAKVAVTRYPITIEVERSERLSRLTTFFRFIMAIPHYIVLYFIGIAAAIVIFTSWWAILFIGRYPSWAFDFVSGYFRWNTRVNGYSILLTDKYPPFSFDQLLETRGFES
jgi:RNA polymerase subunit RPABC4/transcription elongation factor Spt4